MLRELQSIIDNNPKATWANSLRELLEEINTVRQKALEAGEDEIPQSLIKKLERKFSIILGIARRKNPPEQGAGGRPKKGKARALIDRLIRYKDEVFLCLKNLLVPFTNNLAEQSIRMMKVKTKVSGCFRTFAGGVKFALIMSYLQTARKHGVAAFTAISNALAGKAHSTIFA